MKAKFLNRFQEFFIIFPRYNALKLLTIVDYEKCILNKYWRSYRFGVKLSSNLILNLKGGFMEKIIRRTFAMTLLCGAVTLGTFASCGGSSSSSTTTTTTDTEDAAAAADNNASRALETDALTITTTIPAN